jgi:hypothetical protein
MKQYVRDWKNIVVEGDGKKYMFQVYIEAGEHLGCYYGWIVNNGRHFYLRWDSRRYKVPIVSLDCSRNAGAMFKSCYRGKVIYDLKTREIAKALVEAYEVEMNKQKVVSPAPTREMSDEERQAANEAREKKEYENYSSSAEYKSGVPYCFYRAKTKTVCAKNSDYFEPYIRRTYFADEHVVEIYKAYRFACMNCNNRATCKLECLPDEDRSYIMRYIASMVDSKEVVKFETGVAQRAM